VVVVLALVSRFSAHCSLVNLEWNQPRKSLANKEILDVLKKPDWVVSCPIPPATSKRNMGIIGVVDGCHGMFFAPGGGEQGVMRRVDEECR
jgi:hypothetical protein